MAIAAEPSSFDLKPAAAALRIINMQQDFLEEGGVGAALGNNVSQLRRIIGLLESSVKNCLQSRQ